MNGQTVKARFWAKVNKQGPRFGRKGRCWLWMAGKRRGYGRFKVNGRHIAAHRFVFGPVPRGLELDHLCRRGLCVRRSHLEAVKHRVNVVRGYAGWHNHNTVKTRCLRGHPLSGPNLYIRPSGQRDCRTCKRDAMHRFQQRRRMAA